MEHLFKPLKEFYTKYAEQPISYAFRYYEQYETGVSYGITENGPYMAISHKDFVLAVEAIDFHQCYYELVTKLNELFKFQHN